MTKAFKELNYKSFHYPSVVFFYGDKPICLKSDSLIRYDVFSDISVLPFIEIYKKKFPNSLFILTERKKEDWLNSLSKKPNLNDNINRNSWKDRLRKYIYGTAKYNEEIYSNSYDEFHQNVDSIFNNCEERLLKISVFEDDV